MSTPSSFPMSSFPSQQALKRPGTQLPAANPTTPAAFVVTTPKSQPTPSTTNHLPAFSSPGGLRPGASPARRGNLDGKSPAIGTPGRGAKTLPNSTLGVNSPANAQLGITPLLGAGIGSPASFAGLDGLGMKLTMSNLGLSSSALGKMDDDERRRRLETVLTTLRRKPGRISQEGLERLSRRYGFDNMWEADARTGRRTLQMAGSTVLIGVSRHWMVKMTSTNQTRGRIQVTNIFCSRQRCGRLCVRSSGNSRRFHRRNTLQRLDANIWSILH